MPWNRGRRKTPLLPGKDSMNEKSWTPFTVHSQPPLLLLLLVNHSGSVVSYSFATPWNVACWAPLSMEFPRQEYLSGLPFLPPGDLPNPGMEPLSPALAGELFTTEQPGFPEPDFSSMKVFSFSFPEVKWSHSVMSDSLRPHRLKPARILCPWDFPGKNTGVGCYFLLQEIFPTQGLNPGIPHCRQTLYHLSHQRSLWGNLQVSILYWSQINPSLLEKYLVVYWLHINILVAHTQTREDSWGLQLCWANRWGTTVQPFVTH